MKLASEGLPNSGRVGYEIFDKTNLGMTDFVQKINYRRALEGELAKSIMELDAVQDARVHLVIPEHRLFAKDQEEATASILLSLQFDGGLSAGQVKGITHLVASSVEGMKSSQITIVDQFGNLLTPEHQDDPTIMASSKQVELKRDVEKYLERQASSMLENVVGRANAIVKVSAEVDFDQVQQTIETYDPDRTVVRSEERTADKGATGSANQQNATTGSQSESIITNYEVSRTLETIVKGVGYIKQLSVAVIVDGDYVAGKEGESVNENGMKYEPRSREDLDRLANIVKGAVGFRADRGDVLQIENLQFDNSEEVTRVKELKNLEWRHWIDIGVSYLIKAVLLLGLFIILRKSYKYFKAQIERNLEYRRKLSEVEDTTKLAREIRKPKLLDQIKVAADENPAEMAKVIKTLMVEE